jgi:uncharacterized membrane protein
MRREDGYASVMIVGFFLVVAMLTVVVVNATDAYLARQELGHLADSAALAAADGLREEAVYTSGLGQDAPLDPVQARRLVAEHLAGEGVTGMEVATTTDGVRVRLTRPEPLAFTVPGMPQVATVRADAHASLRLD